MWLEKVRHISAVLYSALAWNIGFAKKANVLQVSMEELCDMMLNGMGH